MPARYETIAGWVNEFGWTAGVELGVFDGRTHFYLLEHCPELHLLGVDLWGASAPIEGKTKSGERCQCDYCNETRKARRTTLLTVMEATVLSRSKRHPRSRIIKAATAASANKCDRADFVFVDADHSREGVTADIQAWRPKVRDGGRLIGHDWNMQSVRDAVLSIFPESAVHTEDDHLWWVQC